MNNCVREILRTLLTAAFILLILNVFIYFDKSKCYEQAELYESEVVKYSFIKQYCFIKKDGKNINIDKVYINQ